MIVNIIKEFVLSLVVWVAVVAMAVAIMFFWTHNHPGPEFSRYAVLALILGFVVVFLCWFLRGRFGLTSSSLICMTIGVLIPILGGWVCGRFADYWASTWGHAWTSADARVAGLQLAIPSGLAGAIIGLIQANILKPKTLNT